MTSKPFRTTRVIANLKQGRNDWYQIKNAVNGVTPVAIYDEIGYFGITAQDFIADLANITGPVELHLNTPGGEVFDGIAIYGALAQRLHPEGPEHTAAAPISTRSLRGLHPAAPREDPRRGAADPP